MSELEESLAAPDSTTREQRAGFSHGDDVLQHKDGKFYLGTVVEVRINPYQQKNQRCSGGIESICLVF